MHKNQIEQFQSRLSSINLHRNLLWYSNLLSWPAFLFSSSARLFNLFNIAGDLRIARTPSSILHILFNSSEAMKYPSSLFLQSYGKKEKHDYKCCSRMRMPICNNVFKRMRMHLRNSRKTVSTHPLHSISTWTKDG